MCILMFVPLVVVAAIAEGPRKPRHRAAYRKRTCRTFCAGR